MTRDHRGNFSTQKREKIIKSVKFGLKTFGNYRFLYKLQHLLNVHINDSPTI